MAIGWPFNWLAVLTELPSVTVNCFFYGFFFFEERANVKSSREMWSIFGTEVTSSNLNLGGFLLFGVVCLFFLS